MEKLRDIKGLVEIPDYSFFLYIFFIVVVTTLAAVLVYLVIKAIGSRKKSKREEVLQKLRSLNLDNPKEVAYAITRYGRYIVNDSARAKMYEELVRRLTPYKYKKEVPKLDSETKKMINLFLRVHDE
ncbi:hypothetical protein [Nitratiruptor sp. YY09-18]|uniref:hypothetical protein n=1 Tax=Nitratiruptor sp. YY09-18 TaxID=2724901 RepID=UPI0019158564|nr:hypothetical protein [Nitratiruptor sp. YY09-18]BCD67558.1 hypothetical protein NitYY0918_C0457 [Nitratiruptor sp. YY09-18]